MGLFDRLDAVLRKEDRDLVDLRSLGTDATWEPSRGGLEMARAASYACFLVEVIKLPLGLQRTESAFTRVRIKRPTARARALTSSSSLVNTFFSPKDAT